MWSMREQKKSSVAGQANITAELPEISRYWISNWEFAPSAITPERQCLCGLWGGVFRGDQVPWAGQEHGQPDDTFCAEHSVAGTAQLSLLHGIQG